MTRLRRPFRRWAALAAVYALLLHTMVAGLAGGALASPYQLDVFGNVILCTPGDIAERIHRRVKADVNLEQGVAYGACRLPHDAGLIFKVLGRDSAQVKKKVREFWGIVRKEVTGADLPPPFLWR